MNRHFVALAIAFLVSACGQSADDAELAPYASRYEPMASDITLITGATILTGAGERLENTDILLADGKIIDIDEDIDDDDAVVIDATGKWVTPGIIDVHSHLGVCLLYTSPSPRDRS